MRRVFLFVLGLVVLLASLAVMVVAVLTALAEAECGNGTPTTTVTAPGQSVQTMGEMVRYLETQSIPAVDGAGIVGNLMQESTLDPDRPRLRARAVEARAGGRRRRRGSAPTARTPTARAGS